MKRQFFSAVLSAIIFATASVGITASAEETPTEEQTTSETLVTIPPEETENLESTATSSETTVTDTPAEIDINEFMNYMSQFADAGNLTITENPDNSSPDYYGDDYYDTKGNATLIKSEQIIYNTEEMQFIAVTTKDGNVFYVLINYSAENGEDNVYFLNKVDAIDLYSLIYMTDEEKESGVDMSNVSKAEKEAQKALGNVDYSKTDSDTADTTENNETTGQEQPVKKQSATSGLLPVIAVVAIVGIGGAGFFILKKKPAKKTADIETEDDEEINFYDDEINEDDE